MNKKGSMKGNDMSTIQRFRPATIYNVPLMEPDGEGKWVEWKKVEALIKLYEKVLKRYHDQGEA